MRIWRRAGIKSHAASIYRIEQHQRDLGYSLVAQTATQVVAAVPAALARKTEPKLALGGFAWPVVVAFDIDRRARYIRRVASN